jgi:hypothetical protein
MSTPTKKQTRKLEFIPEILYEAPNYPGEKVSPIPYIVVPKDKGMPDKLFVMEYRQTGEHEVGDSGKPEEIMDGPYPHMYVDFIHIEKILADMPEEFDKVRIGLGLEPLVQARKEGNEILNRVVSKANDITLKIFETQQERKVAYEQSLKKDMEEGTKQ